MSPELKVPVETTGTYTPRADVGLSNVTVLTTGTEEGSSRT